jgi:putative transposase
LEGNISKRLEGMIKFACQLHGWEVYELAIDKDHVHLHIGADPKWSPSQIIKVIKGGTSKKIREIFPDLDEVYWGATFWGDGYLVKSVGEMQDKVIMDYVKRHGKVK